MRPTSGCSTKRLRRRAFAIQQLLLPIELDLDADAADAVRGARERLGRLGIVVELEEGRPRRITALAETAASASGGVGGGVRRRDARR